jgi:2-iminobutanoate/2-iminopropanoate deaminase
MTHRGLCASGALYAAISALALFMGGANCYAQPRRAVNLSGAGQHLPFSDGIIAGKTLYVSGEQGTDAKGNLETGISAQTRAALENIRKIVSRAGFSMKDLVAVNVYLSDIHDFQAMNRVYAAFLPNPKPARTTVQVAGLVNGAKIEISAIAAKD